MTYIKRKNCQIMGNITNVALKFEPMIEKRTMANHAFFAVANFRKINSFAYIDSIII